MANNYVFAGDVMQHTASGNIASGAVVVMGGTLGVALMDIANTKTGPVSIRGVFRVPKVAADTLVAGDPVVWDVSALAGAGAFGKKDTSKGAGDVYGGGARVHEGAGNTDATVLIAFTGVPGLVQ